MSDDFPEFPEILRLKKVQAPPSKNELKVMATDTDVDTEDHTDTPEPAKPKAKAKAKPKVKAKSNGANGANGKTHKAAPAPTKAKTKAKAKDTKRAPRQRDPAKLDEYGFRKDSIKSQAAALYKKGATLADVKAAVGSIQFNVLNELEAAGHNIKKTDVKGKGGRTATKYQILAKGK